MTVNSIAYANYLENARHNKVVENETERSNRAREDLTQQQNSETIRSNKTREGETERHNLQTEKQAALNLTEETRANMASEANNYLKALGSMDLTDYAVYALTDGDPKALAQTDDALLSLIGKGAEVTVGALQDVLTRAFNPEIVEYGSYAGDKLLKERGDTYIGVNLHGKPVVYPDSRRDEYIQNYR